MPITDAIKQADDKLFHIGKNLGAWNQFVPVNFESEKKKFFALAKYQPQFTYPALNRDVLMRALKDLEGVKVGGDDVYAKLIGEKRDQLKNMIRLILARGMSTFSERSKDVYAAPTKSELRLARGILKKKMEELQKHPKSEIIFLAPQEVEKEARRILDSYGLEDWRVVFNKDQAVRMKVKKNREISIHPEMSISARSLSAALAHEVGVHVLRMVNGEAQPLKMFARSTGNYLRTEEGLAGIASRLHRESKLFFNLALSCETVSVALAHSFRFTYRHLRKNWGLGKKLAFQYTFRAKRGLVDTSLPGAFTRDAEYLRGVFALEKFLVSGGKIRDLYIGKVDVRDIDALLQQEEIVSPKCFPEFFVDAEDKILDIIRLNQ